MNRQIGGASPTTEAGGEQSVVFFTRRVGLGDVVETKTQEFNIFVLQLEIRLIDQQPVG